ncbi:hypothetical protein [Mesorhizobium loti]|uniref:hypothetical protein n=1 Tax=Rhizobium loti TaxID=381 RepID=UPI001267F67E|nr:hypothetical protein [Mesorhizobium loti]
MIVTDLVLHWLAKAITPFFRPMPERRLRQPQPSSMKWLSGKPASRSKDRAAPSISRQLSSLFW